MLINTSYLYINAGSFAKLRDQELLYDISLVCEGQIMPAHQVGINMSVAKVLKVGTYSGDYTCLRYSGTIKATVLALQVIGDWTSL